MKKIISLILTVLMLLASAAIVNADTTAVETNIFSDVPKNHWAKTEIEYFYEQGIVDGYGNGIFKPSGGVTREEFCKLLVSTFKYEPETPKTQSFSDVKANRWSYKYVEACRNFLTAYSNPFGGLPSFRPTEDATREDIAVALVLMMGYTEEDAKDKDYAIKNFADGSSIAPALRLYVSIACEKGLINGYPDGTFGPTKGISRAETVVLLNRVTKQAAADLFPGTTQPEKPVTPVGPEKPVLPERPTNPENPSEPEKPVNPEKPTEPEKPVTPEKPTNPSKEYIKYGVINEVERAKNDKNNDVQYIIGYADGKAIETITNTNTGFRVTTISSGLAEITVNAEGIVTDITYNLSDDIAVETFGGSTVETVRTSAREIVVNGGTYKIADDAVIYVWDNDDEEWGAKTSVSAVKNGNNIKAYQTDNDIKGFNIILVW